MRDRDEQDVEKVGTCEFFGVPSITAQRRTVVSNVGEIRRA